MKWIGPLFENAGGWKAFVSFSDGIWYVKNNEPVKIGDGKSGVMLLPILDERYGNGYAHQISVLKEGLSENNQNPEEATGFPFHVPVVVAFKYMPGWVDVASDWVQHLHLNTEVAQEIFDACQKNTLSQAARHKALKVINKWAKEHGFQFVRK